MKAQIELVATSTLAAEDSRMYELSYFIMTYSGAESVMTYGIRAEMRIIGDKKLYEIEETSPISRDRQFVLEFVQKLANGCVTPLCLHDVVDEFFDEISVA